MLKWVNHSVWLGIGNLHTNSIESLWHQIKQIINNFAGINMDNLAKIYNNDENEMTDYLDGCLCFALYKLVLKNWIGWEELIYWPHIYK